MAEGSVDFEHENPHQTKERTIYVHGEDFKGIEIQATQIGRVVRVMNGDLTNYLIDVTDSVEPNQKMYATENPKTVRELYPDFDDPEFNNLRGSNNGIVVTITDQISSDHEKRVYISHLGELVRDENGNGSFPDSAVIEKFNFRDRGHGIFVPYSFNSSKADEFFAKEIYAVFSEQENQATPLALDDPNVIEVQGSVK